MLGGIAHQSGGKIGAREFALEIRAEQRRATQPTPRTEHHISPVPHHACSGIAKATAPRMFERKRIQPKCNGPGRPPAGVAGPLWLLRGAGRHITRPGDAQRFSVT